MTHFLVLVGRYTRKLSKSAALRHDAINHQATFSIWVKVSEGVRKCLQIAPKARQGQGLCQGGLAFRQHYSRWLLSLWTREGLACGAAWGMEFRLRNTALAADHPMRLDIQATENAR